MKWFVYFPLNVICMVVCYITNPLVVLFANEVGELKGFLHYWQTWDDCLDVDWFVKETVPEIFRYDFDSKYITGREAPLRLAKLDRDKGCVILKNGATFTLKERLQRYFCRVLWLTRNCGYGFAFYWFGCDVVGLQTEYGIDNGEDFQFCTNGSYWRLTSKKRICSWLEWNVLIGWKLDTESWNPRRCMIANRIAVKIK